MNQVAFSEPVEGRRLACADVMKAAERELASFFSAVKELFGPEQAELAARDWVQELQATDVPAATTDWRQLTINAAKRLALRVNH
ncbi:MAG TPA: hypothetical protein VMB47_11140 [Candidatus Aquilonibacter sp.]|nr:hypothetical protein [Candidatus Aquilonibacter sp.]